MTSKFFLIQNLTVKTIKQSSNSQRGNKSKVDINKNTAEKKKVFIMGDSLLNGINENGV